MDDIYKALKAALLDKERGYGRFKMNCGDDALRYIARMSSGDVRTALSALELAFLTTREDTDGVKHITLEVAQESVQKPVMKLDESLYYDMLSAFIKSMRGSDPDAALLWFARLIYAGVDPRLIVRRIIVHASEDVGLADPVAMLQAHAAANALETVGMPEARIPIAQAILAICMAEKSNSVVEALGEAQADAEGGNYSAVPVYLRDQNMVPKNEKNSDYKYPHMFPDHFVKQTYMPEGFETRVYYRPSEQGNEAKLKARLERRFGKDKKP